MSLDGRRTHRLTERALEDYMDKIDGYHQKLSRLSRTIDEHCFLIKCEDLHPNALESTIRLLDNVYVDYINLSDQFTTFLERKSTAESKREISSHRLDREFTVNKYSDALHFYQDSNNMEKELLAENTSMKVKSASSSRSHKSRSNASSALSRQRIKTEVARQVMDFIEKEAELHREKASLEADTVMKRAEIEAKEKTLKATMDFAMADAELRVLEEGSVTHSELSSYVDQSHRTSDYVKDQNERLFGHNVKSEPSVKHTPTLEKLNQNDIDEVDNKNKGKEINNLAGDSNIHDNEGHNVSKCVDNHLPDKHKDHDFERNADIVRLFTRKQILDQRLRTFDDNVENYISWKETFQSVVKDIEATAAEELDLLIKFTGRESSRQVNNIRKANAGKPSVGLLQAWERLDKRYGSPVNVMDAMRKNLGTLIKRPLTYKDREKLYELSDILSEIRAMKENTMYSRFFSSFDSPQEIQPIVSKLPIGIQTKWRDRASSRMRTKDELYPPFGYFCDFVQEIADVVNNPCFKFEPSDNRGTDTNYSNSNRTNGRGSKSFSAAKTTIEGNKDLKCVIHTGDHTINNCFAFRHKTLDERKALLKQYGVCFKCCAAKHLRSQCEQAVKCGECGVATHATAMHVYRSPGSSGNVVDHGGENTYGFNRTNTSPGFNLNNKCTEVCDGGTGKSCAKIVLVNIHYKSSKFPSIRTYAIVDEQSNSSLANGDLFDKFRVHSEPMNYNLNTCSGKMIMSGRRSSGFVVESLDGEEYLNIPSLIECDLIPNNRHEIPTQNVAKNFEHLVDIAHMIPPIDDSAQIQLLLGRDILEAHHIMDQRLGQPNEPIGQRLKLGWVIVGESCLDGVHVSSMKTFVQNNGRPSSMEPCENFYKVCEVETDDTLFRITKNDNKLGLSVEDKEFQQLMSNEMKYDSSGNWIAPLPFKGNRPQLPNNRQQALNRTKVFSSSLHRDPVKKQHVHEFMEALISDGHAERASVIGPDKECWYLPLFGVYHPKKRDKIRMVFDSSAKFRGLSLNDTLMSGPNLVNSLLGVLLRFRKERVAVMADLRQMFYSFRVRPDHRDYLRFVWHKDNDLKNDLVDYRMKVHVFGNSPSPAVATFGLRKTAEVAEATVGSDVKSYVERNFYVDDALSSHTSVDSAVSIVKRTQKALLEFGNLQLHKICSNSAGVLSAFKRSDLAKDLKNLDFDGNDFPMQRSLGVCWNLQCDSLTFQVSQDDKPFTRRGVLSTINELYDPLGIAAPVTIEGKLILRESMTEKMDWDVVVSPSIKAKWEAWRTDLTFLESVHVSRMYNDGMTKQGYEHVLLVFSDASEKAVAAVAYILSTSVSGKKITFVLGKAKVAPKHGHSIPRLELCAAVLAVELYEIIRDELDMVFQQVTFYTDSKVVLGYIHNQTRRFYVYVENRVDTIRRSTKPEQWKYVSTKLNPADEATRGISSENLGASKWLNGPSHLLTEEDSSSRIHPLVSPDEDKEVRVLKVVVKPQRLGCQRFERFSSWTSLARAVMVLKRFIQRRFRRLERFSTFASSRKEAEDTVIRALQHEKFPEEIDAIKSQQALSRSSGLLKLSPFLDESGLLRVGGRLSNATNLQQIEMHPLIIPKHHLATLLIRHFHEKLSHQGRHFTEGLIRSAGFWLVGGKRSISSYIHNCVLCRKARGTLKVPHMADLPSDRLDPAPPFTYIGIDVFGPWTITTRRTRGGQANSKRWALLITCLVVRAVHIEVLEEMTASCFINALRRFCSIRGEVKVIRSDCGTNFVGSVKDLKANIINVGDRPVKNYIQESGINWIFNPPHSSHMGGAWERMIGVARRILDNLLWNVQHLTHDILTTLLAEVASIINARPLVPVSSDPDCPLPLTPATILTVKTKHSVVSFKDEDFSDKLLRGVCREQWRCVQHLANSFWKRWKNEYLPTLQVRRKWEQESIAIGVGDIVLLRDKSVHRNDWPIGIITQVFKSDDGRVRKVDIRLGRDRKMYTRPVCEVVILLSE